MALTTISPALQDTQAQYTGFKNRIINGAMMIDQRNAGAAITSTGYPVDRFQVYQQVSSKLSAQQNGGGVTPPAGFSKYLGITSSSSYSVGSTEFFFLWQAIEGYNVADLAWGTANAVAVTLSFKVYSSKTGTFGGSIQNGAQDRSYPFTYTVSSANTWTSVGVTIPGDTSGTWLTTNGSGMQINFDVGSGSTRVGTAGAWAAAYYVGATGSQSIVATSGATFYITGVQLEKGSTATSFDYRPYGTELNLCYRYCYVQRYDSTNQIINTGYWGTSTAYEGITIYPVPLRANPTVSISNITSFYALEAQVAWRQASSYSVNEPNMFMTKITYTCATNTSFGKGQGSVMNLQGAGSATFSAEL